MPPDERRRLSELIWEHVATSSWLQRTRVVALYAAVRSEVETAGLFLRLRERGIACAYPRVVRPTRQLEFSLVDDLSTLRPGMLGILEPPGPAIPTHTLDLIIMPGLAFDCRGGRLGYGSGFYDRALATYAGTCLGLAFSVQLVSEVPVGDLDRSVDAVATEDGVLVCAVGDTQAQQNGEVCRT